MHWGHGIFGFSPCFTHFYLFAHIFCSFPPHPLFFYFDFSPPRGSREGRCVGPMCGPALDPRPKSLQSVSVPESVDETQTV